MPRAPRVLIVNTKHPKILSQGHPNCFEEMADPRFRDMLYIARPTAGTTATHLAVLWGTLGPDKTRALFSKMLDNGLEFLSGNRACAQNVGAGEIPMALTDTDDALLEIDAGRDVKMVYLDSKQDQLGTLFIPNTVALIKGAPHPEEGKKLIEFLLSPEVEKLLAEGPSGQIPLSSKTQANCPVKRPPEIKAMDVDWEKITEGYPESAKYVHDELLVGK